MNKEKEDLPVLGQFAAISPDYKLIRNFFCFLEEKELSLAEWVNDNKMLPYSGNFEDLLLEYFKIDKDDLERERRKLLDLFASGE